MEASAQAMKAYTTAAAARDPRVQEAEVFLRTNAVLQRGRQAGGRHKVRALVDNARLWGTVIDLLRDPENALPMPTKAAIVSIGLAVQREMRKPEPNFDFLIGVNENIAAGLRAS